MPVAVGSFSIREYTARMRAVDLNKCLPFDDGGVERSEAAASLPPISFRKFRWWSDELAVAGEENSRGQIAGFHDDSEMETIVQGEEMKLRSLAKEKQRTPKKRSIVELFAVAPQIETVDDDDHDDERAEENRDVSDERHEQELVVEDLGCSDLVALASRMKKSKKQIRISNKKEMMRRKIQMKYKNKKKRITSAKKEKILRPKMSCVVDISLILQGSMCKKRFGKGIMHPVDSRKKKPGRSSSKKHNFKFVQTSKLTSKNLKESTKVFPIHSILKNRTRAVSTKNASLIGDAQSGYPMKPCCKSEKHVTFSGKDEILGNSKSFSPMEIPQLQSLCKMFSDVLAASSAIKESSNCDKLSPATEKATVVKENTEAVATSVVESTVQSSSTDQQSLVNLSNMNFLDRGTIDLNFDIQSCSNMNFLDHCSSLSPRRSNSKDVFQAEESLARTSNARSFHVPIGGCATSSDANSTLTITERLLSQASAKKNQKHVRDSFPHSPKFQLLYPEESCGEKQSNHGFMGLPLNSQGELINSDSSGTFHYSLKQNPALSFDHASPLPNLADPNNREFINSSGWFGRENLDNPNQPDMKKTVRLMGADYIVSKWTDMEIITEKSPSTNACDEPRGVQWLQQHQSSEASREDYLGRLEAWSSSYHNPSVESHARFDRQSLWTPGHQFSSKAMVSKTSNNLVTMGLQNVYHQMKLCPNQGKHIQNFPYSTTSTSHPPVQNHVTGNLMNRSSPCPSSSHLPHWLMNVNQQNKTQKGNHLSLPPLYPAAMNYPPLYSTSGSQTCGSSTPASLIPSYPEVNANNRGKMKTSDQTKVNFADLKLLDRASISKRRYPYGDNEYPRQVKRPNLEMHQLSNAPNGPKRREQLLGCVPSSTVNPTNLPDGDEVLDIGQTKIPNDGGLIRTGPVKLIPGAKHILKPSQIVDRDNSRLVHSIKPFASGSTSGRISVPLMKAAKVYRF